MNDRTYRLVRIVIVLAVVTTGHAQSVVKPPQTIISGGSAQPAYVVQSGDTLTAIARRFYGQDIGSNARKIFQANRSILQSPDALQAGQRIILPGFPRDITQQKMTSGDILSETSRVKVMTYNIRVDSVIYGLNPWDNRRRGIQVSLTDNDADIIGLQEALSHQVAQMQQVLPQHGNYRIGRNDGNSDGETCAIFYRKDRFAVKDCGTFWFSDTPSVPGSKDWGNMWPRICSWVHLNDKRTGTGLYVYNLHLDHFSQNSRRKSVELLAQRIASRKTQDPFIVMGDFNMEEQNSAMVPLKNLNHRMSLPVMKAAWQCLPPDQNSPTTQRRLWGVSGRTIDHIWVGENTRVLQVYTDKRKFDGRYPSDHFPVIATIHMPEKSVMWARQ